MASAIIPILKTTAEIGQFALPIGVGVHALYKGYRKEAAALGVMAIVQKIVLLILKNAVPSPRPPPNQTRLDSFPSGHTAGAFLAVGFIFALSLLNPRKDPYLTTACKVSITGLAFVIGVSRVLCGQHWPLDVLAGAFLGFACGSAAVYVPHALSSR